MKLKLIKVDYPQLYELFYDEGISLEVFLYVTPFCNCQTFCIGNVAQILSFKSEIVKDIFNLCCKTIQKRQCVIDINNYHLETFENKVRPLIQKEQHIDYINYNGSHMTLFLLTF